MFHIRTITFAICNYMELNTEKSTKSILKLLKGFADTILEDTLNSKKFILYTVVYDNVLEKIVIMT